MKLKILSLILALMTPSAFVSAAAENSLHQGVTRFLCLFLYNMIMDLYQQPGLDVDNQLLNLRRELDEVLDEVDIYRHFNSVATERMGVMAGVRICALRQDIRALLRSQPGFPGDEAYIWNIRQRIEAHEGIIFQLQDDINALSDRVAINRIYNIEDGSAQALMLAKMNLDNAQRDLMLARSLYYEWQDDF